MSYMLDEDFDYFYNSKGFGPQINSQPVPASVVESYRGKLPDALLTYWQELGWGGYGNGLLWLVDPREYSDVLNAWLHGTDLYSKDRYHLFAYGAFGDLYAWGERTGPSLHINSPWSMMFPTDNSEKVALGRARQDSLLWNWFGASSKKKFDEEDEDDQPLFDRAVKLLGRLEPGEMYGFVPALALGAPCRLNRLQKVKAVEHLMFLAQVQPPRVMLNIVQEAKKQGLM
ncbi:GAD-like domain-containing protein [Stenotrophomonas humi]